MSTKSTAKTKINSKFDRNIVTIGWVVEKCSVFDFALFVHNKMMTNCLMQDWMVGKTAAKFSVCFEHKKAKWNSFWTFARHIFWDLCERDRVHTRREFLLSFVQIFFASFRQQQHSCVHLYVGHRSVDVARQNFTQCIFVSRTAHIHRSTDPPIHIPYSHKHTQSFFPLLLLLLL